jgi:hypothetical protein
VLSFEYAQRGKIRFEPDRSDFEMPERDHKLKPFPASFVSEKPVIFLSRLKTRERGSAGS